MSTTPPIAVDDEDSWPEEIRESFESQLDVLRAYEEERMRLNALEESDWTLRFNRPRNAHESAREALLQRVAQVLVGRDLIGYHCARLHEDDLASITAQGLLPLNRERLHERVRCRVQAGDIPSDLARRLVEEDLAADSNRVGMIWFIFTKDLLQDEAGISRLLHSWGGEALYVGHEDDEDLGPLLRSIGTPCIVEAAVPIEGIQTFFEVQQQLLHVFLDHRGINTGYSASVAGYVSRAIGHTRIRRVLKLREPDFDALTDLDSWRYPPQLPRRPTAGRKPG